MSDRDKKSDEKVKGGDSSEEKSDGNPIRGDATDDDNDDGDERTPPPPPPPPPPDEDTVLGEITDLVGVDAVHRMMRDRQMLIESRHDGDARGQEQALSRSRRMRYRFRAIIRVVMMSHRVVKSVGTVDDDERHGNCPVFNYHLYLRSRRSVNLLPHVKRILGLPPLMRSDEDTRTCAMQLCNLPFFEKFLMSTQYELAKVLMYESVGRNRVIIRQGHPSHALYYVLSGALVMHTDRPGEPKPKKVGKLYAGDRFGETTVVYRAPRTETVTTFEPTELLYLFKDDFDTLLRTNMEDVWRGRHSALLHLPHFRSWTDVRLVHCSSRAKLVKYDHNKVIIGNIVEAPEQFYFIVDGQCRVIEELRLVVRTFGEDQFRVDMLPIEADEKETKASAVTRRYINLHTLHEGDYFGSGEDLRLRYVVAFGRVDCLLIPHAYLRRHHYSDWVTELRERISMQLPDRKQVFTQFQDNSSWRHFRKRLISVLTAATGKPPATDLRDVPLTVRQNEETEDYNAVQNIR